MSETTTFRFNLFQSQLSGSTQSGVHVFVLSLKSPFTTCLGASVPIEELKDIDQIVIVR